jgi:hypothetical protein
MSTLPDVLKKQIDNIVDGLKFQELEDRTLPGFLYDTAVLHKNGKPYFIIVRNILDFIDLKVLPSVSNLILYGYEQSPEMQEYLENSIKEKLGIDFDMSYVLNRKEEKKYLNILIPLLQGGTDSSNQ